MNAKISYSSDLMTFKVPEINLLIIITGGISQNIIDTASYSNYIWRNDKHFIHLQPIIIIQIWTELLEE